MVATHARDFQETETPQLMKRVLLDLGGHGVGMIHYKGKALMFL